MNFWEDNYCVEEDGGVYSYYLNDYLKPQLTNDGYKQVGLCINGKDKKMKIHRLVALTYIPNEDNKPQVDHIDRSRSNNHYTNLRWVTKLENMQNVKPGKTGERHIHFHQNGGYYIMFTRNKNRFWKHMLKTSTLEQAIIRRDLMLSMFII